MGQCNEIGCVREAVTTVRVSGFADNAPRSGTAMEKAVCQKCADDIERMKQATR